jgi:hypothetical protein
MIRSGLAVSAAVSFLVVLTACAEPTGGSGASGSGDGPNRYEADGTVLESADHGPQLCIGGVAESYPPQCTGLPIIGWDWNDVTGEDSASGTTWGEYHVVGTYDGTSFTLLEVGRYRQPPDSSPDFTPPCPEPPGGWAVVDGTRVSDADLQAVMHGAESEPDSAGFWIDYIEEPTEFTPAEGVIAIAAFTGDLERHEGELRDLWGGALCVTQHERTQAELEHIQAELDGGAARELGLEPTVSWVDTITNTVHMGVVVAGDAAVAAVADRYGEGVVVLEPALRVSTEV